MLIFINQELDTGKMPAVACAVRETFIWKTIWGPKNSVAYFQIVLFTSLRV